MEKLERSEFTRAGEIANRRLVEAVLDPDRYPEGTTFIAADQEGFGSILAEAVAEHRPLAIVYPDGREIVAAPRQTAQVANSVATPEAWHEVGAPGEPGFLGDYKNAPPAPLTAETVGFYKDREGIVRLKGLAFSPTEQEVIFQLPPGYRPASGRFLNFTVPCSCHESKPGSLLVIGPNSVDPSLEGAVVFQNGSVALLDSVTFRAES